LRARAEKAERAFEQELYAALVGQARATVGSHEVGQRVRTLDALRRAAAITNAAELRPLAMAALALPDLQFKREIALDGEYAVAELDPSFNRIALGKGDGPIEIRAVPDHRLLATLPSSSDGPAYVANWSSDGRFLGVKRNRSVAGNQSDLEVWSARDFQRMLLVPKAAFGVFCFDPRLPRMLGSCGGGAVAVWDLEDARQLAKFPLEADPDCLAISPDGQRFAAACKTKTGQAISVYRMEDGARLTTYPCSNVVSSLDWHPDGRWIAAADASGAVYLVQPQTGARRSLGHHKVQAVLARFSPDGGYVLSGGWERELIFWDLSKMERALTLRLGSFSARFRADGRECALAGKSGVQSYLQIHSFELPACDRELPEDLGGRVHFAAFSSDGEWLAAAGLQRLGVWDLTQPGPGTLADTGADARLYFAANDQLFASHEDTAFRWRPGRPAQAGTAPVLESLPLAAPNGLRSLCAVSNRIVWTTSEGSQVSGLELAEASGGNWTATTSGINGASPDGRWLAIYQPFTPRLLVYQLPGLELARTITNAENIGAFAFSPSGDQLAVMSSHRVQLWRTSDWRHLGEVDHCHDILFCPQEPLAWLTRDYSEAGLYDLRSMALMLPLPTGWLPLALSQDGRRLAVSIDSQRVQVWDLERLVDEIRALGLDWPGGVR
jgi:WD40 repeat protein